MAATILSFHLLGRFLETRAKGRASQAIQKLLHLGAKTANRAGELSGLVDCAGIVDAGPSVLPEGKVERIRELQQQRRGKVAMVGDGINDAPALKQADIGIAIGAGADVTIEAAGVTLVTGELTKVVEAVRLSSSTFRKILQILFWAWIYNVVAIPIAAIGLLHPMIGVIAMTVSSLSVVGNSLLLKRARNKD